ncbi:MAG: ribonuclease H-like domain-containing protein, partial [Candidatus Desulfofervidaceae bacterium]|nr:ribonuclease H-like domain-containing protein [Candidatus Desulfofervidaceae bacterium]
MKLRLFLLDTDYITEKQAALIRLWGKTASGENVVVFVQSEPYFYILPKEPQQAKKEVLSLLEEKRKEIRDITVVKRKLMGEEREFLKVTCFLPQDSSKIRDVIKTLEAKRGGSGVVIEEYEYALNFYRRFLIDNQIDGNCWVEVEGEEVKTRYKVNMALRAREIKVLDEMSSPPLKILAFDLETHEQAGKKEIVMASFYTQEQQLVLTNRKAAYPNWVKVTGDEKELLEEIVQVINDINPDIIVTFYGDAFDFQVLNERCQANKIKLILSRDRKQTKFTRRARVSSARINGVVHIDLFHFINNILSPNLQTEVLSLDAVSSELLGDRKIEMDYQEMLEAWRKGKNLVKLAEYCLKDAILTYRLAEIILPQIFEIARTVGQVAFDVSRMTYGQLVEWYLSRKAHEERAIIPNQPKYEDIIKRRQATYIGGFVKEPLAGLHE